ncbi:MAG: hypothetical protein KGK11_12820 [Sphingomonadales bacterium]|nr:hypothetical protein [Sphingomonadales bacterium]
MPHNPTTFAGEPGSDHPIGWDDPALLHRRSDTGLLHDFTVARHGTLAQLVHQVMVMTPEQRAHYTIERQGDRQYDPHEIVALSQRPDYPG